MPAFLAVGGLFDADWRLAVACRNGKIYTIKVRTRLFWQRSYDGVLCIRCVLHLDFVPLRTVRSREKFMKKRQEKMRLMYAYMYMQKNRE